MVAPAVPVVNVVAPVLTERLARLAKGIYDNRVIEIRQAHHGTERLAGSLEEPTIHVIVRSRRHRLTIPGPLNGLLVEDERQGEGQGRAERSMVEGESMQLAPLPVVHVATKF